MKEKEKVIRFFTVSDEELGDYYKNVYSECVRNVLYLPESVCEKMIVELKLKDSLKDIVVMNENFLRYDRMWLLDFEDLDKIWTYVRTLDLGSMECSERVKTSVLNFRDDDIGPIHNIWDRMWNDSEHASEKDYVPEFSGIRLFMHVVS